MSLMLSTSEEEGDTMNKTSSAVKNRYNSKAYDRVTRSSEGFAGKVESVRRD